MYQGLQNIEVGHYTEKRRALAVREVRKAYLISGERGQLSG